MKEIMELCLDRGAGSLSQVAQAMQEAAIAHSYALSIDHDRILEDFGCLWMLVRYQIRLSRLPKGPLTVQTFLRSPAAAFSLRDFSFFDAEGCCGEAVQTWVLADSVERKIRPISQVPALSEGPFPQPERSSRPKRFRLPPELPLLGFWTVAPEEIDDNGHLNNVAYVRHAEALAPTGGLCLDVCFERECFAGEQLRLEGGPCSEGFCLRFTKENGELSFSALFGEEVPSC